MGLQELTFDEGEEKLALAFQRISLLERSCVELQALSQVDQLAIASLMSTHESPQALRATWQESSSEWIASTLITCAKEQSTELFMKVVNERVKYWTELLIESFGNDSAA